MMLDLKKSDAKLKNILFLVHLRKDVENNHFSFIFIKLKNFHIS